MSDNGRPLEWPRDPQPRLALALALAGLLVCAIGLALTPAGKLDDPLTVALSLCAVCAAATYVPLGGTLLIDASFVPLMLAIGFLGPWPAFVVAAASELGAWFLQRYRLIVVPINALAVGGVALIASLLFKHLSLSPGLLFYLALGGAGVLTLVLNYVVVVSLIGLLDGYSIRHRLGAEVKLVPALALNVALAVAVADVYANSGVEVIIFVLALILAFNYMVRQTLLARRKTSEVEELAAVRGRLVAQTLDAEERERRVFAETLHDGPIQLLLTARQDLNEAAGNAQPLESARRAVDDSIAELRHAVRQHHPSVLRAGGLQVALEALGQTQSERGGFCVEVDVEPKTQGGHDRLLFSIARELLTNAAKHSHAHRVEIRLRREQTSLRLTVRDDGDGFDPEQLDNAPAAGHIGLAAVIERAETVQGSVTIKSATGQGTAVHVDLPLPPARSGESAREDAPHSSVGREALLARVSED